MVGYTYLDHVADLAVRAWGTTLDEAFCEAARALCAAMVRIERVEPGESRTMSLVAGTVELLLVDWLAALLAEKDTSGLMFSRFGVRVSVADGMASLHATVWGETLDPVKHEAGCEVKGISLLGLRVREGVGRWTIEYVADV